MKTDIHITLIRHTSVNVPAGYIYGHLDVPVNSTFNFEAKNILPKISTQFNKIYSSPSIRCTMLANTLFPEQSIQKDERLRELNFGNWEGQNWNDVDKTNEATYWFKDYLKEKCPNGESYQDLLERVECFIKEIQQQNESNIAIVTHGGVIRAFLALVQNIDQQEVFNQKINFGEVLNLTIEKEKIYAE